MQTIARAMMNGTVEKCFKSLLHRRSKLRERSSRLSRYSPLREQNHRIYFSPYSAHSWSSVIIHRLISEPSAHDIIEHPNRAPPRTEVLLHKAFYQQSRNPNQQPKRCQRPEDNERSYHYHAEKVCFRKMVVEDNPSLR